jgi:outer membrane immunogenic protein
MKRTLLLATAIVGLSASGAFAQEYSGFYAGISAGYNFQGGDKSETILFDTNLDGNFDNTVNTAAGVNAFSPGFCGGRANSALPADGCAKESDNVDLGIRAGYDWQFDNIVIGALGEFNWTNLNDSVSAYSTTPARYTMTRELDWTGSLRARAGLVVEGALAYVTGGYVRADAEHTFSTSNGVNTFTTRGTGDIDGYQLGGGVDWNVTPEWRVGLEYLYTDLSDKDYRVRAGGPAPATNPFILTNASGTDFRRSESSFDYGSVRLTLSYRFGG